MMNKFIIFTLFSLIAIVKCEIDSDGIEFKCGEGKLAGREIDKVGDALGNY